MIEDKEDDCKGLEKRSRSHGFCLERNVEFSELIGRRVVIKSIKIIIVVCPLDFRNSHMCFNFSKVPNRKCFLKDMCT